MMSAYIATIALFMIDLFQFNEQEELGLFMLVVGVFIDPIKPSSQNGSSKNRRIPKP